MPAHSENYIILIAKHIILFCYRTQFDNEPKFFLHVIVSSLIHQNATLIEIHTHSFFFNTPIILNLLIVIENINKIIG